MELRSDRARAGESCMHMMPTGSMMANATCRMDPVVHLCTPILQAPAAVKEAASQSPTAVTSRPGGLMVIKAVVSISP
jgi:hypothetical protein